MMIKIDEEFHKMYALYEMLYNLDERNKVQIKLWKALAANKYVNYSDMKSFAQFGKWFAQYTDRNDRYPSYAMVVHSLFSS